MATAIATMISIALLLTGAALAAQGSFKSVGLLTEAWQQMETRTEQIGRTKLEIIDDTQDGAVIDITLRNDGQKTLMEFSTWDVIVEYYSPAGTYYQKRLPHTGDADPGNNQWTERGIYVNAGALEAEMFQPGILDPDEEMVIRLKLSPPPSTPMNGTVIIGTFNGVTASTMLQ